MFNTMTVTKVVGGFAGTLLVFLLGSFVAGQIFNVQVAHDQDGKAIQGYVIDTGGDDSAPAAEETVASFDEIYAEADASKGEKVFSKCRACHKLEEGANSSGPYLYGVVGRDVDTAEGYSYSGALEKVVDVWTPEHLNGFLENPQGYAPGTAMTFAGLKKIDDRANLIAYLATFGG